jgi:Xaa-Pro aminopeptidase
MFDYPARRRRLSERLEAEGIEALFLAPSADLEYLTGVERQVPNFGEASYAHGWVTGAVLRPGAEPVFIFPRMFATFDLPNPPEGEIVVVNETDDGHAAFERVVGGLGRAGRVAVGDRAWAETVLNLGQIVGFDRLQVGSRIVNELRRVKDDEELAAMVRAIAPVEQAMAAVSPLTVPGVSMAELVEAVEHELRKAGSRCPSFTTHMFSGFAPGDYDSGLATAWDPVPEGTSVMFDFGAVVDGYCSDFGRTIFCGTPSSDYLEAYDVMIAAYEAGRAAAAAGVPAREVNAACRRPIEEAGYGEHFRHRMGHGIGMNVHERPFLSEEDETPLEAGMTFTDEPSIMIPGRFSVRIEDVIVCEEGGGRTLNSYGTDLVSSGESVGGHRVTVPNDPEAER